MAAGKDPVKQQQLLEAMMERGEFELVAVGRALLQDPEWAVKVRDGRHGELQAFDRSAMATLY